MIRSSLRIMGGVLLTVLLAVFLTACGSGGEGGDGDGEATNVSGYWAMYHTETGGIEEGPDYWNFTQTGNNITGVWVCEGLGNITGSINGTNISFLFGGAGIYGEDTGEYGSAFEFEFEEISPTTTGTYIVGSDFGAIDFQNADTPYNLHAYGGSVTITSISPMFEGTFTITNFAEYHSDSSTLSGSVSGSFSVPHDGSANGIFIAQGTIDGYNVDINTSTAEYSSGVSLTGTITDNTMAGTFTAYDGSGTWRGEKRTIEPDCGVGSTSEVYGGETYLSGTDGYNPEEFGYTLLGTASSTQSFSGSYSYYIIVTRPVNIAYVDTVQGSNGAYYGTNTTGNTADYSNVGGVPDGKSAAVGGVYNGTAGGYIVIDASKDSLSSITVYITTS